MTALDTEISDGLTDFKEVWNAVAKEIRSSNKWKEMKIYSRNKKPPAVQQKTVYKVLNLGEAQNIPIGTSDLSKVEIKARVEEKFVDTKKPLKTLCLLGKRKNLKNLNFIKIDVTDNFDPLMKQLKRQSIDFSFQLIVKGKFVVIRRYTIDLSHQRDRRSGWSRFIEYSIPWESLMPNYGQHMCCGGCYSGYMLCIYIGYIK